MRPRLAASAPTFLLAPLLLTACARRETPPTALQTTTASTATATRAASQPRSAAEHGFHSDYFVFVSADAAAPLIVPIDLNWEWSDPSAVTYELKAWRGTRAGPWPMFYLKEPRPTPGAPAATWPELTGTGALELARDGRTITVSRPGDLGRIVLAVPTSPDGAITREPYDGGEIATRAARTTAEVDGTRREGWLIHEHIAITSAPEGDHAAEALRFAHFHWIPVLGACGQTLYLFRAMGDGSTRATRWTGEGDGVKADVLLGALALKETETAPEATSGRTAVPRVWSVAVAEWKVSFTLHAVTAHTGYGDAKAHGRALYGQILAEGTEADGTPTHGMVELILAD